MKHKIKNLNKQNNNKNVYKLHLQKWKIEN